MIEGLTLIIVIGFLLIATSIVVFTLINGISPMPSSSEASRLVAGLVKSSVRKNCSIVEAGSGWGTLLFRLARMLPEHQWIGVENSHVPYWSSLILRRIYGRSDVSIKLQNMYTFDFNKADVVICYLYPGAMLKLKKQLEEQLQPEALVISICFAIPQWEPIEVLQCRDLLRTKIYMYANKNVRNS